jgi:hypothetical protein
MTIFSLQETIGRQATGWAPSFASALKSGRLRPATAIDLEQFAATQRSVTAATRPSRESVDPVKPPVTLAVREHLAGLRQLLRVRAAGA